eukprot:4479960-Alexandrium_andersonii.AAC.1
MPNLPTKRAGGRAGGASGGVRGGGTPRGALCCATGYRASRIDSRSRGQWSPNRPNRVLQGWKFKDGCKFKDGMRTL